MSLNAPRLVAALLALWVALPARPALAQDPYGPGMSPLGGGLGGPSPPPPPQQSAPRPKPKADENEPELHAAPGGSDSTLPEGNEPSLPEKPLEIKPSVAERIGTSSSPDDASTGEATTTTRRFYGPYYEETSGEYRFRTLFPLWLERMQPSRTDPKVTDRASLYGIYYNRRSAERSDDILFPLFWNLNDTKNGSRTTIVGPLVNRVAPGERDNWLAPLYFTGKRPHGGYTLIPPLLTYTEQNREGGFTLIGPGFCSWKGGPACDTRTAQDIDFGIAPFYFYGQDREVKYEVIPPLLHYYRYDDRKLSWLNIWGPYFRQHTQERDMFHLLPFYWSIWGENERHTTVLPFFHYGWKGNSWLFINPLYMHGRGENGESTFVTWGYARYRGRTTLDMITPLYWRYTDPDIGLEQELLFPFLYSRTSPRESNQVFFPFWAHFERYGVSETTWVTPFFRHSHDLRGWSTAINPILYIGRSGHQSHTVVAPFFFDFVGRQERQTVAFPLFWRFASRHEVSQLVGNVYYHERQVAHGTDWEVHIFPAFSYGETPDGHWWNVLYGLAGYTRRGSMTKMRTFWIPIELSK